MKAQTPYRLLHNSRFYILAFSLLLSITVFAWLRLRIDSDQLLSIRTQQLYGFICLGFWYATLIISPLGHAIGKHRLKHLEFARRAIGVSAFYFALLHAVIALFGQLSGPPQLQHLPDLFKWSLVSGGMALLVLALMAATSFDAVIRFMTFRKWKWLHRLVYLAGVCVILHIWMIGTHLSYPWVQLSGFAALALLTGLELLRMVRLVNRKYFQLRRAEAAIMALAIWAIALAFIAAIPTVIENYHSRHTEHAHSQEAQ